MSDYYVYVYIDPRNFEEFYFGKGRGSRKNAHLSDNSDSEKAQRISEIRAAGLEPIIRVIARELSEHDALLVEKTLLWKMGRMLTNVASGHYVEKFRPHNTLHVQLSGFDFQNGLFYYNVGEGPHRHWDDFRELGFISAGQGKRWREAMRGFQPGDVVAAYLKGHGYVDVGRVLERARPVRDVSIDGRPLLSYDLRRPSMAENAECDERSEYVCPVDWIATVDRDEAKWQSNAGIYSSTHVRASLDGQPFTIAYLAEQFAVDLHALVV